MGDKKEVSRYFIIVGLLVLLYITFLLVKPYLTYVLLAFLLAYACYPIYNKLQKKIKNKTFASAIMIIAILIIIFIPLFFIVSSLVDQSRDVYGMATRQNIDATLNNIENALHLKEDLNIYVDAVILRIKESTLKMIPNVITGITEATVGLFIMFFIMF